MPRPSVNTIDGRLVICMRALTSYWLNSISGAPDKNGDDYSKIKKKATGRACGFVSIKRLHARLPRLRQLGTASQEFGFCVHTKNGKSFSTLRQKNYCVGKSAARSASEVKASA